MRRGVEYRPERLYEAFALSFSNYDVIDPRIDVSAQQALIRLRGNPATSADAARMLAAVKRGRLAGIYGDDLRAAAELARRRGTVRWLLVPRGQDAALIREPNPVAPPTIIFRTQLRSDRPRLDRALHAAWRGFNSNSVRPIPHPQFGFVWSQPVVSAAQRNLAAFASALQTGGVRRRAPRPIRRPMLAARREAETGLLSGRSLVSDTSRAPLRWICSLIIDFGPDPRFFSRRLLTYGTGLLISPRHVLTAAHCLFNFDLRDSSDQPIAPSKATGVTVTPGRNSLAPNPVQFGSADGIVDKLRFPKQWQTARERRFDFGLITLERAVNANGFWSSKDKAIGNESKIMRQVPTALVGKSLVTSGYPADKCGANPPAGSGNEAMLTSCNNSDRALDIKAKQFASTQWLSQGRVQANNDGLLDIVDLDAVGGQSGAPLWTGSLTSQTLAGLIVTSASGPTGRFNQGLCLTDKILAQLRAWMRADRVAPQF